MMNDSNLELRSFSEPSIGQYRALICDPAVTKHMPLSEADYTDEWIENWVSRKEATWGDLRLGPWSVWRGSDFVGWAGLEPIDKDLSLGLVLHKKHWGTGKEIVKLVLNEWSGKTQGRRLTVEFPASRKSHLWAASLGLVPIDTVEFSGVAFTRYELPLQARS